MKISAKEMEKRLAVLRKYVDRYGLLGIARECGFKDTTPISQWFRRKSIPDYRWKQLEPTLKGRRDA